MQCYKKERDTYTQREKVREKVEKWELRKTKLPLETHIKSRDSAVNTADRIIAERHVVFLRHRGQEMMCSARHHSQPRK